MSSLQVMSAGRIARGLAQLEKDLGETDEKDVVGLDSVTEIGIDDNHPAHIAHHAATLATLKRQRVRALFDNLASTHKSNEAESVDQTTRLTQLDSQILELDAHIAEHRTMLKSIESEKMVRRPRLW